jgi:hypothetical protein
MTPQQLIGTGIRLFSIWLALSSVAFFSAIPTALSAAALGSGNSVTVSYAVGALYVLVAIGLWVFPMSVAHKLLPRTAHANRLELPGFELARVGVGLLGLWVVAKALPTLVWVLFRAFLFVDVGSTFSALTPDMKLEVGVAAFELLLGVVFVVQSGGLARAVMRSDDVLGAPRGEP